MNTFTKSLFGCALSCAVVNGQGLYSIAPNDDEAQDSLPLTFLVGAAVGYDDNPTPLFGGGGNDGSGFASVFAQANLTSVSPQTTWDVYGRIGARFYFNDLDGPNTENTVYEVRAGVNFTHRFSERLRFSSRNYVAYEVEPDFEFGFAGDRRGGQYFRYGSSNSVGYRWSERLGTQTSINFNGINYIDLDDSNFNSVSFGHQFRYRLSPATVVTAGYRFRTTDNDLGGDVDSHFITAGVEHRISPVSAVVLRGGVQITSPDRSDSRSRPFVEGTLRSQLTEQLGVNLFVRYSQEGYNRSFIAEDPTAANNVQNFLFEQSQTLRFGGKFNYALSPTVSLFGGVNYILTDYEDQFSPAVPNLGDVDEGLLNLNAGASLRVNDSVYLTTSYNFTTSFSDFDSREYDRNRVQVGIQTTF